MENKQILAGYGLILKYIGVFMIIFGIIMLLPLTMLILYPQEYPEAANFVLPGTISIFIGYAITLFFRGREKGKLARHQDAVLVLAIWIVAILIGAIPFLMTGNLTFTQSVFEVTSGVSTTGLSVLDADNTLHIYLFYRSLLLFFGGVGFILIMTTAVNDRYGMRLFNAEGHNDRIMANLIKSARMILLFYTGFIALGTIAYVLCGVAFFDAINHSIAAVSTGGFSTRTSSIGYFNNVGVEIISIILMFLGATNFMVHMIIFRGKIKKAYLHSELKLIGILALIFLPILFFSLMFSGLTPTIGNAIRTTLFQFSSALTTTGFQTVATITELPKVFIASLIILMIIGGGLGSTAGGIKQYRIALALKSMYWNFKEQLYPKNTIDAHFINRYGKKELVTANEIKYNYGFLGAYLTVLVVGTTIFTAFGNSIEASLFEFASALSTVGLSVGIIGYNAHPVILWTATFGMILGRLEFYVVLLAIYRIGADTINKGALV
jgi:trk system potassium uptake protein TrkH